MTRSRRITDEDRAAASQLSALWKAYKLKNRGASQEAAGASIGLSQAVFSQYLLGTTPLGVEATLKFAHLFGVRPKDIRPDFKYWGAESGPGVQQDQASNSSISAEARDIAIAWQNLSPTRQRCFREIIFLEAATITMYPWLGAVDPSKDSYKEFEARVIKDFKRRNAKQ